MTDIRGCAFDFHSMPNATSRWWEHYWTRCRIEPQHISCTLTGFFRITFYWGWILGCFGLWWRITLERSFHCNWGKCQESQFDPFQAVSLIARSRSSHLQANWKHRCRSCFKISYREEATVLTNLWDGTNTILPWRENKRTIYAEETHRRQPRLNTRVTEKKRKEIAGILSKKLAHCEKSQLFKWKK